MKEKSNILISGRCLNFNSVMILVLVLRYTITILRNMGLSPIIPLDHNIYFHKLVGVIIFFQAWIHTIMHLINFGRMVFPYLSPPSPLSCPSRRALVSYPVLAAVLATEIVYTPLTKHIKRLHFLRWLGGGGGVQKLHCALFLSCLGVKFDYGNFMWYGGWVGQGGYRNLFGGGGDFFIFQGWLQSQTLSRVIFAPCERP